VSREEEGDVVNAVRSYADNFSRNQSPNVVMHGNTGTGKTHLACALASRLLRRGMSVTYLPILTLFSRYQDITSYGGEGSREEFFSRMRSPDLLIIDEFGIVTLKDSERITLHRVIDERYNRKSPIVLIGNARLEELEKEVGERAMRRVMADAMVVPFDWAETPENGQLFSEA